MITSGASDCKYGFPPKLLEETTALLALEFRTLDLCRGKIMNLHIAVGLWKYYVQLAVNDEHQMFCGYHRSTSCAF